MSSKDLPEQDSQDNTVLLNRVSVVESEDNNYDSGTKKRKKSKSQTHIKRKHRSK